MKLIAKKVLVVFASLYTLTQVTSGVNVGNHWYDLFYGSVVLSALYWILKPVLGIIFFPLNMITLNLSSLIIDVIIFYIWTLVFPAVMLGSWTFQGYGFNSWQMYVVSALILSLLLKFYGWLIR